MKQSPRIYYSDAQKALMWDRWKEGESLNAICDPRALRHFLLKRWFNWLIADNRLFTGASHYEC